MIRIQTISFHWFGLAAIMFMGELHMDSGNEENHPFIDPQYADNTFFVDCGNVTDQLMRVMFRGDAVSMYAVDSPDDCLAEELEPAYFEIPDARTNQHCQVQKIPGLQVYYLEVILQRGNIRKYNDPVRVITCNYELGGTDSTGHTRTGEGNVVKHPEWLSVGDAAESNVTLHVFDTFGKEVTESYLGSFLQLKAHFYGIEDEESLKIWNCRAFSDVTEYYILVKGCGDGDVVKKHRGFLTSSSSGGEYTKEARSVYFRMFSLPQSPNTIQFECNYIVCRNTSCDGVSCDSSPRARRSADNRDYDYMAEPDPTQFGRMSEGLPVTTTSPISIYYPTEKSELSFDDLLQAGDIYDVEDLPGYIPPDAKNPQNPQTPGHKNEFDYLFGYDWPEDHIEKPKIVLKRPTLKKQLNGPRENSGSKFLDRLDIDPRILTFSVLCFIVLLTVMIVFVMIYAIVTCKRLLRKINELINIEKQPHEQTRKTSTFLATPLIYSAARATKIV